MFVSGFLCLLFCGNVFGGYFTIVGPRTLQHGKDYKVTLAYKGDSVPTEVNIAIEGNENEEEFHEKSLTLTYDSDHDILFEMSENPVIQDYKLIVKSGTFNQAVVIHTIAKKCSVLIQTDKAIYKPNDKVQFRVLILDAETKPYHYKQMTVNIMDAVGNVVYEKSIEKDDELVFEGDHSITEDPFLGNWVVSVQVDDDPKLTRKTFEVKEYILPRFEVFADTKEYVTLSDDKLTISVYAKYTFGEFVKGKATITARVFDSKYHDKLDSKNTFEVNDISTRKSLVIDLKENLKILTAIRDRIVKLEVQFEEELTKKLMTIEKTVTVRKEGSFNIEVIRPQLKLKPGFPYKFKVIVRQPDGSIESRSRTVIVKAQFYYSQPKCTIKGSLENENKGFEKNIEKKLAFGAADFELQVPQNTSAMTLKIGYFDTTKIVNVLRHPSKTREYLEAKAPPAKNIVVGKPISIKVESSTEIGMIRYLVIGRTGILVSQNESFATNVHEFKIKFMATSWMVPEAQVLIYYIHFTGEVIYDQLSLPFEENLPNKLEIALSSDSAPAQPRDEARFTFRTNPDSTVYLLAVDRSVNLLQTGNNIDKKSVSDDLKAYNAYKNYSKLEIIGSNDDNRYIDVGNSNAFILTNAYEGYVSCHNERLGSESDLVPNNDDGIELDETLDDEQFESKTRTEFPETWIFEKIEVNNKGFGSLERIIPDTMTTWDITGFSLSEQFGLGIADLQKLVVAQKFFLMVHLPYSIRVGEILKVEVTVFNYFAKPSTPLNVDVTLYSESESNGEEEEIVYVDDEENSNTESEFDFFQAKKQQNHCEYTKLEDENRQKSSTKRIKVVKNSGTATHFYIKATKAGDRKLKVRAQIARSKNFDEVVKTLKVEHEGRTEYRNKPFLVDLRDKERDSYLFAIFVDDDAVKNSIKIETSVMGDLIGPALVDTEKLIIIPAGCYEQRLKAFIPNVVAMNYLNATKKLTPAKLKLGEDALRTGVEQALETRITSGDKKGAFSIWSRNSRGESDSIWLTAYVAKCLGKAKHLIQIKDKILFEALNFLKGKQEESGKFPEYGKISYYNLQTDSSEGIPLTAFTVIAFLENTDYREKFNTTIFKALNYIDMNFSALTDNYALAIATYALALGGHSSSTSALVELKKNAFRLSNEMMYWEKDMKAKKGKTTTPESTKVEIAAYAILAHVKLGMSQDALPIVNWLVSRRNSNGGFSSSHDTVIGIQALAEIALELYSETLDMDLKFSLDNGQQIEFKLNQDNRIIPQNSKLPSTVRTIRLNAVGKGIASVQVSHSYNLKINQTDNVFNLKITETPDKGKNILHLTICAKYSPQEPEDGLKTGMAILEVSFPSGYVADPAFDFLGLASVKRYELKHENTLLILYFDNIDEIGVCPQVQAIRQKFVDNLKPSPIKVYDYYKLEKRTTEYYLPSKMQPC